MVRVVVVVRVGRMVWIVVGIAMRRVLLAREAVSTTRSAPQRVGHARHFHVRWRLRRCVRLQIGERAGMHARVVRTVLPTREPAAAITRIRAGVRGAGGCRRRQREPALSSAVRRRPLRTSASTSGSVPVLRPRLCRWWGRLARCRVCQRPDLRLRRWYWDATL